jgi:hypothetical protein
LSDVVGMEEELKKRQALECVGVSSRN